jgi:hypothetical protein
MIGERNHVSEVLLARSNALGEAYDTFLARLAAEHERMTGRARERTELGETWTPRSVSSSSVSRRDS